MPRCRQEHPQNCRDCRLCSIYGATSEGSLTALAPATPLSLESGADTLPPTYFQNKNVFYLLPRTWLSTSGNTVDYLFRSSKSNQSTKSSALCPCYGNDYRHQPYSSACPSGIIPNLYSPVHTLPSNANCNDSSKMIDETSCIQPLAWLLLRSQQGGGWKNATKIRYRSSCTDRK